MLIELLTKGLTIALGDSEAYRRWSYGCSRYAAAKTRASLFQPSRNPNPVGLNGRGPQWQRSLVLSCGPSVTQFASRTKPAPLRVRCVLNGQDKWPRESESFLLRNVAAATLRRRYGRHDGHSNLAWDMTTATPLLSAAYRTRKAEPRSKCLKSIGGLLVCSRLADGRRQSGQERR